MPGLELAILIYVILETRHWCDISFVSQDTPEEKKRVSGYIEIDPELCKECHLCISVCPRGLIGSSDRLNQKGYRPVRFGEREQKKEDRKCTGCGLCAIFCPEIAIEVYRG